MSTPDREARQQILDAVAQATDALGRALAGLGAAYEQLDEAQGDRLESAVFRPLQRAYGRAQRTYTEFAARYGLPARSFAAPDGAGVPSTGVARFLEDAAAAIEQADAGIAELQDSLLPVEVGDQELRAGLSDVRSQAAPLPRLTREVARTFGR